MEPKHIISETVTIDNADIEDVYKKCVAWLLHYAHSDRIHKSNAPQSATIYVKWENMGSIFS